MIKETGNINQSEINIHISNARSNDTLFSKSRNIVLQKNDVFIREKSACKNCDIFTTSIRRKSASELTWMWCAFASVLSLCILPFFIDSCNDIEIYCAECLELK